jgi:hypothetical protein
MALVIKKVLTKELANPNINVIALGSVTKELAAIIAANRLRIPTIRKAYFILSP